MREPRLQFRQARRRRTGQRRVAPGCAGERGPHQPLGQELPVRVAGVEGDGVVRRRRAWWWRLTEAAPAVTAAPPSASRSPTGRAVRTARTKVPTPGRLSIRPCAVRVCSAFCTVTGLAWYSATSDRVDGSLAPGAASAIHSRSRATIRELLSLFMRDNSSATTLIRPVILVPAAHRTVVGPARSSGLLLHGSVHPGRRRRALAAVHRLRPRGGGRGPGRLRPRAHPAAASPRRAVGPARGGGRRRRRRLSRC